MNASSLLDRIADIATARPFSPADVGFRAGMSLTRVPAESNPYFDIYRSDAAGPLFASLEVRSPTALSAGRGGMVIARIDQPRVSASDVGDRFGTPNPGPPVMPGPRMPPDSPRYTIYRQSWGELRLGFSPSSGCLVTVVLDGI